MKLINKLFTTNLARGAFYSLTIVLGLQVSLQELDLGRYRNFVVFSLILSGIFMIELYSGWIFRVNRGKKFNLTSASQPKRIEELVHHLLLPLGLYILSISFIYYNRQDGPRSIFLALLFIALTVLFTNIRAFYESDKDLEHSTHAVYDGMKLIMYFIAADVLFYVWPSPEEIALPIIALMIFGFGLLLLSIIRYKKFEYKIVALLGALAIINGILLLLAISLGNTNQLQTAAFAVTSFYVSFALVHHRTHRTLSYSVVAEYGLILAIALILVIGLA